MMRRSLPLRLWFIEAPLDGSENLRRNLGAHDRRGIEMVFEVQRHVDGERRGPAAAEAQHARQQ